MEAVLAHGQTNATFMEILKLAIHHQTDVRVTNKYGKGKFKLFFEICQIVIINPSQGVVSRQFLRFG